MQIVKFYLLRNFPILLLNDLLSGQINETNVKILKFGTPQIIAIIVLKIKKFDVTFH